MGYTITIGDLEIGKSPEDAMECSGITLDAKGVRHDDAPAFGEPTDYTNSRWPSYSVWSDFMMATGLYDLFFTERGHLIGGHPGVRLITKPMVDRVGKALSNWRANHPEASAQLGDEVSEADAWLCRLIWLDYWLRWSLENCDTPVIANS